MGPCCCSSWRPRTGRCSRGAPWRSSRGPGSSGPMGKPVLVIAAHPDDELLGCGGTAALHARAGDEVTAVIACEGESLRYGPGGVGQGEHIQRAARVLGLRETRQLGFADLRLDTLSLVSLITPPDRPGRDVRPAV